MKKIITILVLSSLVWGQCPVDVELPDSCKLMLDIRSNGCPQCNTAILFDQKCIKDLSALLKSVESCCRSKIAKYLAKELMKKNGCKDGGLNMAYNWLIRIHDEKCDISSTNKKPKKKRKKDKKRKKKKALSASLIGDDKYLNPPELTCSGDSLTEGGSSGGVAD